MKNVTAIFATLLLFVVLASQTALAGNLTPPEKGAVPLQTFKSSIGMKKQGPDIAYSTDDTPIGGAIIETTVWMVESGETVYTLDVNTAEFYMPCGWAKKIELPAMMDMFARGAIEKGIQLGFTHCDANCAQNVAKVYYATCVKRDIGPSCPSLEAAPDSDYSMNAYQVCCASGSPNLTLLYTVCGMSTCFGGFERTC